MNKRIFLFILMFLSIFLFCCKKKYETEEVKGDSFKITIIDLDDEILGEKNIAISSYSNLFDALKDNFNVKYSNSEYGIYITQINNSIIDNNYSLMLYVDGVEATSSLDKIVPIKDAHYEFKNICWAAIDYGFGATMDETDVLLDKIVYHYLKHEFKDIVKDLTDFNNSNYWEMLVFDLCSNSLADYSITDISNKSLINNLKSTNLNELDSINLAKYYIFSNAKGCTNSDFFDVYKAKIKELPEWNGYSTPFILIPGMYLQDKENIISYLEEVELAPTIEWGPIANLWQVLTKLLYNVSIKDFVLSDYVVDWEKEYEFGSCTDFATVLMVSSAMGIDIRSDEFNKLEYNDKKYDYLEFMINKYYDSNLKNMKSYVTDTEISYSANQIYAGLIAYKIFRDTGVATNIFGSLSDE